MRDGTCKLLSAEEKILRDQGHFNRLHELSADEIHNVGGGMFENGFYPSIALINHPPLMLLVEEYLND